jgi:hypothetical protein
MVANLNPQSRGRGIMSLISYQAAPPSVFEERVSALVAPSMQPLWEQFQQERLHRPTYPEQPLELSKLLELLPRSYLLFGQPLW